MIVTRTMAAAMHRTDLIKLVANQSEALERINSTDHDTAVGALARVEALAAKFEVDAAKGGPLAIVANGIAHEIRTALAGPEG